MAHGQNASIFGQIASQVVGALIRDPLTPGHQSNAPVMQQVVESALAANPVLVNELNGEAPVQSRVLWGNGIAGVGTVVAGFLPMMQLFGWVTADESSAILSGIGSVAALAGVGISVYGRLATGLRPLFSRKSA